MIVSIDFFKKLFKKNFNIGTNQQQIDNNQLIDEQFVEELLNLNENQFIERIKNMGYTITDESPKTNIMLYICYKTAELLCIGNSTLINPDTTLKTIIEKSKEFEDLALKDINYIVQRPPIGGFTAIVKRENICP